MRPLRRPYAEVTAFYAAYRRWAELLARPEWQLTVRLAPGDCLVFDNTRVLHARTAFSMSPRPGRHLQGCYADLDGLPSTLAVLTRKGEPMSGIEMIADLFARTPGARESALTATEFLTLNATAPPR